MVNHNGLLIAHDKALKKNEKLTEKHQALFDEHKEVLEKQHENISRLSLINEHMPKTIGVISLFVFSMVVFLIRPDIFLIIIEKIGSCAK